MVSHSNEVGDQEESRFPAMKVCDIGEARTITPGGSYHKPGEKSGFTIMYVTLRGRPVRWLIEQASQMQQRCVTAVNAASPYRPAFSSHHHGGRIVAKELMATLDQRKSAMRGEKA
jgi:hypothetical protein